MIWLECTMKYKLQIAWMCHEIQIAWVCHEIQVQMAWICYEIKVAWFDVLGPHGTYRLCVPHDVLICLYLMAHWSPIYPMAHSTHLHLMVPSSHLHFITNQTRCILHLIAPFNHLCIMMHLSHMHLLPQPICISWYAQVNCTSLTNSSVDGAQQLLRWTCHHAECILPATTLHLRPETLPCALPIFALHLLACTQLVCTPSKNQKQHMPTDIDQV